MNQNIYDKLDMLSGRVYLQQVVFNETVYTATDTIAVEAHGKGFIDWAFLYAASSSSPYPYLRITLDGEVYVCFRSNSGYLVGMAPTSSFQVYYDTARKHAILDPTTSEQVNSITTHPNILNATTPSSEMQETRIMLDSPIFFKESLKVEIGCQSGSQMSVRAFIRYALIE